MRRYRGLREVFLRGVFCLGLLFFASSILTPWVVKWRALIVPGHFSGEEYYWSFQVVFYPYDEGGWKFGDLGFGREKLFLWDFWFAQETYYYGFTFEWIRLFIFQLLTVFSGISILIKWWTKTKLLLVPLSLSALSTLIGVFQIARFKFVWNGHSNPIAGFLFALFSIPCFLTVFTIKHILQKSEKLELKSKRS